MLKNIKYSIQLYIVYKTKRTNTTHYDREMSNDNEKIYNYITLTNITKYQ